MNELVSLENQVKSVKLHDKLGKQNFHEDMKKVSQIFTKFIKEVSEEVTATITETSTYNNKTLEISNNKLVEIMNDKSILASDLFSPLSKKANTEKTSQFKMVKGSSPNRVNDLVIKNTIPITLHDTLLTIRDTGKVFELKGHLLKMRINKNYNVDLAS